MRHGRKLLVEFEPDSRLRTLKIDLEGGMDWIRPTPPRDWTRAAFTARQTHFVILENHDLASERDAHGTSEWTEGFGVASASGRTQSRRRGVT